MAQTSDFFAEWPEKYDEWFETPIGILVREYEGRLLREMVRPGPGERILDVGCGTGIFTADLLAAGSRVTGLEISLPMLLRAGKKAAGRPFHMVRADMRRLPFTENSFDKTVSVTAIEFLAEDAADAVADMFRVTRPGGLVFVASLNSLSPWAARRMATAENHPIFNNARFRSPAEMKALAPYPATVRTAVHFQKHEDPRHANEIEDDGNARGLDTGAFLAVCWKKPGF
jgi:ubiquinone/menaquinone biosynthesis C-methylase UbiE